jgi:hypothetical protein
MLLLYNPEMNQPKLSIQAKLIFIQIFTVQALAAACNNKKSQLIISIVSITKIIIISMDALLLAIVVSLSIMNIHLP